MCKKNVLIIAAVAILVLAIGQVQAVTITVPNGDFELIFKPGTAITGNVSDGGWSQGVGPDCPIDGGGYVFSDRTIGADSDIPGWVGYDRGGWVAGGGTQTHFDNVTLFHSPEPLPTEILRLAGRLVDLYEDKKIDFKDFAELAVWWLDEQPWP